VQLRQQLTQAQKLESLGQLAAGIAHEINTPVQYIGDNARFGAASWVDDVNGGLLFVAGRAGIHLFNDEVAGVDGAHAIDGGVGDINGQDQFLGGLDGRFRR